MNSDATYRKGERLITSASSGRFTDILPTMEKELLKVLITDPHRRGGGQVRYVTQLAAALARRGHHVTIGCKRDSILVSLAEESKLGVFTGCKLRGGFRPPTWIHDISAIRRYIQSEKPDIIHANGSQDHWVLALGNRSLGNRTCMVRTRHNTYAVSDNYPNKTLNLKWTDFQIAVCEVVRQMRVTRPTFDANRMVTIHNGVDPKQFQRDTELRRKARAEFGYADSNIVVGMAARMALAKGHKYLFEAASKLLPMCPDLRLLILGQGVLEKDLKQLACDLGIASITTFPGFRDDIGICMQAFDIGAQPSIDCEASSFSVMEQMATEIPIVASDHGGTKEIVRDGIDGFIVPQGIVDPLRDALQKLLANASLRRTMGQSARQRVVDEFTLDLLATRTLAAYRQAMVLHRKRNPS